jgi:CubicO group peptidase (beta-lactamase class C family)
MTRRFWLVTFACSIALCLVAVADGVTRDAADTRAEAWDAASCRDVVSTARFAGAANRAAPLVSRMKAAFAAPGLQVAVAVDGKVVWSRVCGYADVARRVRTGPATLFRIGSVTKIFTATALARLVQDGKVDLDAEVQRYVPSFPRKGGPLTIAHLASHQSGIRHYAGSEALNTRHYGSVSDSLRAFARDPLLFPPGSDFSYSSYGFNLLGAALEGATGTSYANVLQRTVLGPLGIRRTRPDRRGVSGRATFYEVRENRTAGAAPRVDLSDRYPSGGLLSTAADVARLGSRLGSPGFLTRATQERFFVERRPASGRRTGYGLGFEVAESSLGRFVRHLGNVVGGTAFVLAHPESRVAIAMTTNVGWVTVRRPPKLGPTVSDPTQILIPFIKAARPR